MSRANDVQAANPTTQQPGPDILPGPTPGAAAALRVKADRASAREDLLNGMDEPAPANDAKPSAPAKAAEPVDVELKDIDDATEDGEPKPAAKAKADEPKLDAETEKRLAAVQKAEARSREKLAAERKAYEAEKAALDKQRAEVEAQRAEIAEFARLRERAKVDPVAAMRALGITDPADLEYAAKQAYAATKADPSNREAAARMMRERESLDKLTATERRIAELEQKLQERDVREQATRHVEAYVSQLSKAATADGAPALVKHAMSKSPEKTLQRLRQAAFELSQELDDVPDHADVMARYERNRRAELEELGITPDSILKTAPKVNDPKADKVTPAKTLGNDLSTPRVPRTRTSEREERDEVRRALESGQLD